MKKICIIGAGIFGCTIALKLSENKNYIIDIVEEKNDIMNGVTLKNQQRFHLGYHYPRSKKTISEIKNSYKKFIKFYGDNIFGNTINLYGISNINSKLTFSNYIKKLRESKLSIKYNKSFDVFSNLIENSILTKEKILDYFKLKKNIKSKIFLKKNIKLKLGCKIKKNIYTQYDKIILCTYHNNNKLLRNFKIKKIPKMNYELIEKIIIKLPKQFEKISAVILDGNFLNFDPYIGTKFHLLSVVSKAKIEIIKNKFPIFKNNKKYLINKTKHKSLSVSNFKDFIDEGKKYVPILSKAKYINSFYTVRCTNIDKNTHNRTNEIKLYNNKIITVLSGKWNTCVNVADDIKKIIKSND